MELNELNKRAECVNYCIFYTFYMASRVTIPFSFAKFNSKQSRANEEIKYIKGKYRFCNKSILYKYIHTYM